MISTPIELLQKELTELKRNLQKSKEMFADDVIDLNTHMLHTKNLEPKIKEYKNAIAKLLE